MLFSLSFFYYLLVGCIYLCCSCLQCSKIYPRTRTIANHWKKQSQLVADMQKEITLAMYNMTLYETEKYNFDINYNDQLKQ